MAPGAFFSTWRGRLRPREATYRAASDLAQQFAGVTADAVVVDFADLDQAQ